jgi:hypothetical protein
MQITHYMEIPWQQILFYNVTLDTMVKHSQHDTLTFITGKKCNLEFHAAHTNAWDNNLSRKEHTKPASQLIL